jgi:LysR family transcriptional regulator, nod-box dependent transcriptional activator
MRFERLDLNLLVALDVLIEECNVSAAARRLHLSQSATSGALLRLRDYFGDELLVSVGSRMVLTERATELRDPVREALNLIRHRVTAPTRFDPATSERHFRIVASDYMTDVALAPLIRRLGVEAPGLTLQTFFPELRLLDPLHRGEIDLILTLENLLDERHPRVRLFRDDHVLVAWKDNKRITRPLDTDLFLSLSHVAVHFGGSMGPSHVERFFYDCGIRRRIALQVPCFSALASLIIGTDYVGTLPRRHARHHARFLPITLHELPYAIPELTEAAQYVSSRANDCGLQWFVKRMLSLLDEQPATPAV